MGWPRGGPVQVLEGEGAADPERGGDALRAGAGLAQARGGDKESF